MEGHKIDRRGRGPDQEKVFYNVFLAIAQHAREHLGTEIISHVML